MGEPGPIERAGSRSCKLVVSPPRELATRRILAGIVVFAIGTASEQNMRLGDNWRLIARHVTLGPMLEEVVFRGYMFAPLMWLLPRVAQMTLDGTGWPWFSRL